MKGIVYGDLWKFTIISSSIILGMNNISDKIYRGKTHILCSVSKKPRKSRRLWRNIENMVQSGRPQITIWRLCTACWITKTVDTHSEYVIHNCISKAKWIWELASIFSLYVQYMSCLYGSKHEVRLCQYTALTLRLLMSYIYGAPILDVSRSHTTTQHSR
jgi:hypothetical protein